MKTAIQILEERGMLERDAFLSDERDVHGVVLYRRFRHQDRLLLDIRELLAELVAQREEEQ